MWLKVDDGENVPIVQASYHGNEQHNTEGLRVYDAWFQHKNDNEIPRRRRQQQKADRRPIRPHHR
jgi:hypothetical protein